VACHSLDEHRTGPALRGVLGRVAGSAAGFEGYSAALRAQGASGQRWTAERLRTWLRDPEALVPGQAMGFFLGEAADRDAVVAYLATLSAGSTGR
jgi:cytochrome c